MQDQQSGEPVSDNNSLLTRTLFHKDDHLASCQLGCLQKQAGGPKERNSKGLAAILLPTKDTENTECLKHGGHYKIYLQAATLRSLLASDNSK